MDTRIVEPFIPQWPVFHKITAGASGFDSLSSASGARAPPLGATCWLSLSGIRGVKCKDEGWKSLE